MQPFGAFKSLAPLIGKGNPAWQAALFHYQRSLVECGTPLELEHAQRIALLFLKRPSETGQLSSWVRLFHFEGVPTCALMLKALVRHDLWRSALNLWGWSPNNALAEVLVDELMSKKMWEQSLLVMQRILESDGSAAKGQTIPELGEMRAINDTFSLALSDTVRLVNDPTFVPAEERRSQSGLSHLVNTTFPMKSQWKQAVSMLVKLSERDISSEARREVLEVAAARCAYHGEKFEDVFSWIKSSERAYYSTSLQRTLMRSAIALGRFEDAVSTLETLKKHSTGEIPSRTFQEFCRLFIRSCEHGSYAELVDRFSTLVSKCSSLICCEKTREEVRGFFVRCAIDTTALDGSTSLAHARSLVTSSRNASFPGATAAGVSSIDQAATVLLAEGHWKAALLLMKRLVEMEAVNEEERVVVEAARASLGCWETAILFFL